MIRKEKEMPSAEKSKATISKFLTEHSVPKISPICLPAADVSPVTILPILLPAFRAPAFLPAKLPDAQQLYPKKKIFRHVI